MRKKHVLVIGIANTSSISAAIAHELYQNGFEIIPTYINDKALKHVQEVTDTLGVKKLFPYKVGDESQLNAIIQYLKENDIQLDGFVHGIAFASEIKKELYEVSWESFKEATLISAFSMVDITRKLIQANVFNPDASILTISYRGSQVAVEGYNMMGPVKSILESLVRGLASELGDKGIRVNAISPGPVMTRAASGINGFDMLIDAVKKTSPLGSTANLEDIGKLSYEMMTNSSINGAVYLVDCGESVVFAIK